MADVLSAKLSQPPSYVLSDEDYSSFLVDLPQLRCASSVPPGFPPTVASSLVWQPEDNKVAQHEWILSLSSVDVEGIKRALADVKGRSKLKPVRKTSDLSS
jgi:hypothetical protein